MAHQLESYEVLIPSRKRPHNVERLLDLLPMALICVDEREAAAYEKVTPAGNLLIHPATENVVQVRNWMITTPEIKAQCLIQVDDDLVCVRAMSRRDKRAQKITCPLTIQQILENGLRVAQDLDVGVFCWNRAPNPIMTRADEIPFRLVCPVASVFGMRGPARRRVWSEDFLGRADFNFTLETLLVDRVIAGDMRFYWDCGPVFSGKGGNVGLLSKEQYEQATRNIQKRWGKYAGAELPTKNGLTKKANRTKDQMSIRVERRSSSVYI